MAGGFKRTFNWMFAGTVSLVGLCVFSELGMRFFKGRGFFIPEAQKQHLKDANHVSDKFENFTAESTVVKPTVRPTQTTSPRKTRPTSRGYDWSKFDEDKTPFPVEDTLTVSNPVRPKKVQPVSIPVQTRTTSTVDFTIDLKSKSGSGRSFSFDLADTVSDGHLKMKVSEKGETKTDFGDNIYLNVVYFNPNKPQSKGLAFSIVFCQNGGFLLMPFDNSLGEYVCLAKGDNITVQQNPYSKTTEVRDGSISFSNPTIIQKDGKRVVEIKQMDILPQVIQSHKNNKIPVVRGGGYTR